MGFQLHICSLCTKVTRCSYFVFQLTMIGLSYSSVFSNTWYFMKYFAFVFFVWIIFLFSKCNIQLLEVNEMRVTHILCLTAELGMLIFCRGFIWVPSGIVALSEHIYLCQERNCLHYVALIVSVIHS